MDRIRARRKDPTRLRAECSPLDIRDPLPDYDLEGILLHGEVLHVLEHDHRAILGQPLQQAFGVFDRYSGGPNISDLGAEVEDDADTRFLSQVRGGEVVRSAKARSIPLDALGNGRVSTTNRGSDSVNLGLERMVEFAHELVDCLRRIGSASM